MLLRLLWLLAQRWITGVLKECLTRLIAARQSLSLKYPSPELAIIRLFDAWSCHRHCPA